jgi:hypothetical protein
LLFDVVRTFAKQFTPVDGGYVYYPSIKQGGKLVTAEEYERLLADWKRTTGWRGLKLAGIVLLVLVGGSLASAMISLPERLDWVLSSVVVAGLVGWIIWAAAAPRRLVKGRPDHTPPLSRAQARQAARAIITWPMIGLALFMSGAVFVIYLISPTGTLAWWAWIIGSGAIFALYGWTAYKKASEESTSRRES